MVVDAACPTVTEPEPDEPATPASPAYVAVTACVPTGNAPVVTHALPDPSNVPVSVGPPAIANVTVPVGVQVPGATVVTCAHKVTG